MFISSKKNFVCTHKYEKNIKIDHFFLFHPFLLFVSTFVNSALYLKYVFLPFFLTVNQKKWTKRVLLENENKQKH